MTSTTASSASRCWADITDESDDKEADEVINSETTSVDLSAESECPSPRPMPMLLGQRRRFEPQAQAPKVQLVVKNTFFEFVPAEELPHAGLQRRRSWPHFGDMGNRQSLSMAPQEQPAARKATKPSSKEPAWSLGSAGHESGECRPCAWFWRPQGCGNGANCHHCHRCEEGQLKLRRKANKQLARELKQAQATAVADRAV
mmetsp:Transcript_90842/g.234576  ORF Transcript_90842/g.234576 Transcript_90842/m.234576 type:complete len:201 (+) Transcript_90842:94-696(+)